MRQTIAGLIAGVAFAATMATAAPAQACAVTDPCGSYGYYAYNYGCGYGYGGCGVRERLARPDAYQRYASPQYYWVNQGPTYTGPGAFAPVPTYQERAVVGSRYYGRPYRYGYDGGPYGNATSHYYDGAAVQGPAVYSYRFARRHAYRGYRHAHYRARHMHMHRHHGHYGHRVKPLRYKY
ncbi:hypothetical protein CSIRO_3549 [Bradyrhizobiaceae bacterium SG-6C]|nr:hypothetical protein CSIRO_3549 [Bradyrhizobiaceae bacterium SG-6C]